jgi:LytS/YehU family sensor histidine kinase
MEQRAASPFFAAVGAALGALVGGVIGLFAGFGVGDAIGLPQYKLGNDPEGFDTLGAALIGAVVLWLLGALIGSRLATRGRERARPRAELVALACMAVLAIGASVVGSATADWYYPLVAFVAAPAAMATATAIDRP